MIEKSQLRDNIRVVILILFHPIETVVSSKRNTCSIRKKQFLPYLQKDIFFSYHDNRNERVWEHYFPVNRNQSKSAYPSIPAAFVEKLKRAKRLAVQLNPNPIFNSFPIG